MSFTSIRGSREVNGSWNTGCMCLRYGFNALERSRVIANWSNAPASGPVRDFVGLPLCFSRCQRSRAFAYVSAGTLKRISPDVGGIKRRSKRPSVVLPQPLSPTKASVSPRRMYMSTPSTARTRAIVRRRTPPLTGKYFWIPIAATTMSCLGRSGSGIGLSAVVQEAGDPTVRALWNQLGFLALASVKRVLAPRMEPASRRRVREVGHRSRDRWKRRPGCDLLVERNDRLQEALRVRMKGLSEQVGDRGVLDNLSRIHYGHAVTQLRNHREGVCDVKDRGIDPFAEILKQFQNLGLRGHIEGRGRLVRDHERWIAGEGHRDHRPLLHSAAQLVRELLEDLVRLRNADRLQQGQDPSASLLLDWPHEDPANPGPRHQKSKEGLAGPGSWRDPRAARANPRGPPPLEAPPLPPSPLGHPHAHHPVEMSEALAPTKPPTVEIAQHADT